MAMKKVIDGGYLSWVFGSAPSRINLWNNSVSASFSSWANAVIIMEGGELFRNDYYPDYKLHRKEAVKKDPSARARRIRVKNFALDMELDPTLETLKFPGLEADDVIAAWAVLNWHKRGTPMNLTAIDKDYVQLLPMVDIRKTDNQEISFEGWRNKQQKTLQPHLSQPWHVAMMLALMGDTSDNVPRLVEAYKLDHVIKILESVNPWDAALKKYGDDFIRNLYLTVLPGAWVFEEDDTPTPVECFEIIASGGLPAWYDLPMREDIVRSFEVYYEGKYPISVKEGLDN